MAELFDGYRVTSAWDEMLAEADHRRRPYRGRPYRAVHGTLRKLTGADLAARAGALARTYLNQGVTFDFAGEERPFPLDVVPRVSSAEEWTGVEAGVTQRVRALEAFLSDVYGKREAVAAGGTTATSPQSRSRGSTPAPPRRSSS